jgi:hypothetical protein
MVEKGVYTFSFSPLASQPSLQTSTVQASNRTTGAAMSLIKKIDVEKHFAAKRAARLAVARMSTVVSSGAKANAPDLVRDVSLDHPPSRAPVTSIAVAAESAGNQAYTDPGSRQS